MHKMEAQVLEQLLEQLKKTPRSQLPSKFISFFNITHKGQSQNHKCSLEDFAIYYLAALRQHTEPYFRINEPETPKALTPIKQPQSRIATSITTTTPVAPTNDLNESFGHHSINSSSSSSICTPGRNQQHPRRSTFSSTPHSNNRSGGGGGNNSLCLGDFLVNTPNQSHHQQRSKKKTTPQQQQGTPSSSSSQAQQQQAKPRRRVLPMTISKNVSANSSFGDTSSFSNDNNLWRLSQNSELLDRSQGAALELETRQTLILKRHEIRNEAPVSGGPVDRAPQDIDNASSEGGCKQMTNETFDLTGLHNQKQLELLATIYEQLLNLNLVPNVLGELGYQLQLLNNIHDMSNERTHQKDLDFSPMVRLTFHKDCIYFVLRLLEYQKKLLMQLDRKSLGVLLQQERLSLLPKDLLMKLELTCQQKQENFKNNIESNAKITNQQQNVYYHQEKDSRDNFPTQNEFGAFKAQRDLFYKCLKYWELSHLNRVFNFKSEMSHKIREIFVHSEHAVNMAHFAKLFVSQLIISASETTESPEELGLKLDQLRLNRLAQRLVTSNSSVEDQFPRSQSFFRDFINECGSLAFMEQLKLALYVQLLRCNDSTFEMVQMQQNQEEDQPPSTQQGAFIVRPQILANMLILAKFLGYIMALPFNQSNSSSAQSTFVCPQQLQLRSHFQSNFDLLQILEHSMGQGKILITLPWLVQYLVMLDIVTLQLPDILGTLDLLYALYAKATPMENIQSEAVFIIRSSFGWLMEAQPQLVNSYYTYRSRGSCVGVTLVDNCIRGLLQTVNKTESQRLPMMEDLLTVACPSLNEFRVTIMTCRPTQSTSRSGRYRYVTTRLEQLNQSNNGSPSSSSSTLLLTGHGQRVVLNAGELQQRQLQEAFLHSQNASMRRLIEFVSDRSFKCVVKDAQINILLPSKTAADAQVNKITSTHTQDVLKNLQEIYQTTRLQACQRWTEEVPHMLDQRIEQSLQALLPANTNAIVQLSYSHIIRAKAQPQLQQWLQSSVMQSNFYHGDLHELAGKICRSNKYKLHNDETGNGTGNGTGTSSGSSSEMCLSPDPSLSLSELLYDLQQWLHCLSLKPANNLRYCPNLLLLVQRARQGSRLSQLPTVFYQLIGSGMVRLNQLLICKQPQLLSQEILSKTCDIWQTPQMAECCKSSPGIFDDLLSVAFIQELDDTPGRYQLLEKLLLVMMDRGIVNANELNEMFMPLFKENWPAAIWTELSRLLQQLSLSSKNTSMTTAEYGDPSTSPEDDAKSHLFMEMLADLSRDLDSF
ncbi:LOW QUALITY PROTEIN: protein disks lost [Drosophila tropicalis]|uniref:LOW QUALITY PROTEIN: protein disks lost n=1 Tax=Drosophila tropicalis TaxID=46794 RepID=UPI0035ABDF19